MLSIWVFASNYMIPRWLEHRRYSYQEYALPIKLRNLKNGNKSTQTWTENMKFEASYFAN